MQLKPIKKNTGLKERFHKEIEHLKHENEGFDLLLYNLKDINLYIIGGFVRDIAHEKQPRDIDMMIDVSPTRLDSIIKNTNIQYKKNRHNGYKLIFDTFVVDCWSIDSNWAFVNQLVKKKENDLKCIAEGTFFNFDSLVFNAKTNRLNTQNYNECILNHKLDIIRSTKKYKNTNPTREANIIRAFYLAEEYDLELSDRICQYISEQTKYLNTTYGSVIDRLFQVQNNYDKYFNYFNKEELMGKLAEAKQRVSKEKYSNTLYFTFD